MGQYTTKGLYNGYDKNHKERDKTDYLSLSVPKINDSIEGKIVLEGLFHASIDIALETY